jgi:nickel transport system ATP-binding protein
VKELLLLNVEGLSLTLRNGCQDRKIVNELSFTLKENRILGLIGESGCGKSLSCLAMMGLLPRTIQQTGGTIRFDGQPIEALPFSRLRAIRGKALAMIMQNPMSCFDAVFTIREHFKETLASHPARDHRSDDERTNDALNAVGFDHPQNILNLYPFQMSGGMLQRAMVALALMMNVKLLIADEPTTDLDVIAQARVLDLLETIRDSHRMAILLVTHDLGVIARLADDVAVMKDGQIIETGTAGDIFESSRHAYTRELIAAHLDLYDHQLDRFQTGVQ